jgi:hypothetical protein
MRGDRDRSTDENSILDGKHDGRMAGTGGRSIQMAVTLALSRQNFGSTEITVNSPAEVRITPPRRAEA